MKHEIMENGIPVGTCEWHTEGLYKKFTCKLKNNGELPRRIYVITGYGSEYLGIADRSGVLTARLPEKRLANGVDGFVAAVTPKGEWQPWRGVLDGIAVEGAFLRQRHDGFDLALPPAQAVQFPEWVEQFCRELLYGAEYALLPLNADGQPPLKEKDNGGFEHEASDFTPAGTAVPVDDFAGGGFGEQGRQADCPDL